MKKSRAKLRRRAPKRQRDLTAEFDQALADSMESYVPNPGETYEQALARAKAYVERYHSAIPRMHAALKAQADGFARSAGIAKSDRPPARSRRLCDQIARHFPREIAQFTRGTAISDDRLKQMLATLKAGRAVKFDAVRRQLTRQFRGGVNGAELRKRSRIGVNVARRLDVRQGAIHLPLPPDIYELFPGLKFIKTGK